MDSQPSTYPDWNDLPNEIKLKIIQNADNNSRLALSACSLKDHQLVVSNPSRRIHKIYLRNGMDEKWHIDITRTTYGCKTSFLFETLEEFKKKLEEEIESSDSIDTFELVPTVRSNQLKFTKSGELLKIRELVVSASDQDVLDILNQIDPSYLKRLKLYFHGDRRDIFETPQVERVFHLYVNSGHITDDQLLNMESSELFFRNTKNITFAGINQYIKKCLLNLENKPVVFRFENLRITENFENLFYGIEIQRIISNLPDHLPDEREVFRVGSNSSNYQLEIEYCSSYIEGRTICRNQFLERQHTSESLQNSFKSVDFVTIEPGQLTIAERNTAPVTYIFDFDDDLQMKLTKEMNKINYIKHLKLQDTFLIWQLCPPNKQVTVGTLSVLRGSFSSEFLQQIEPIHLKEITILEGFVDERIYDMTQSIHAQKLDTSNCSIRNQDFTIMTSSEINKFVKKILTNLNLHDYNFRIRHSGDEESASERLEGLDIYSSERISPVATRIIVNSSFPEFKLKLIDRKGKVFAKRITAEDAEKPFPIDFDDEFGIYGEDSDSDHDDNDVDDYDDYEY